MDFNKFYMDFHKCPMFLMYLGVGVDVRKGPDQILQVSGPLALAVGSEGSRGNLTWDPMWRFASRPAL